MSLYKIHIPDVPGHMYGELQNILVAGVQSNPATRLCTSPEEADYIFLDFRHFTVLGYEVRFPEKTIIVDYRDGQGPAFPNPALLYFKRSVVDRERQSFCDCGRDVVPISYCVKDEYLHRKAQFPAERDIDVAVFFDPDEPLDSARNYHRTRLAQFVKKHFAHLNIFVGIAGRAGEAGRSGFQKEYFDLMTRAKIVVTCNPDRWEGDYRLFEALSSGSLVLSDRMLTPVVHPLIDWEHLIYFDKDDMQGLGELIRELLAHDDVRGYIANNGYAHAMNFHKASDRINEILAQLGCTLPQDSVRP